MNNHLAMILDPSYKISILNVLDKISRGSRFLADGPRDVVFNVSQTEFNVTEQTGVIGPFFCDADCDPGPCTIRWYNYKPGDATYLYHSKVLHITYPTLAQGGSWKCQIYGRVGSYYNSPVFTVNIQCKLEEFC